MILYHGSQMIVDEPEIRKTKYTKDFGWGFYCTVIKEQAEKWAVKFKTKGYLNIYEYIEDNTLNIRVFPEVNEEWLDFVANCRHGEPHGYDIVEGPMADDTIYNFVERYLSGMMGKEEFLALAKFKHPTHQISFHSLYALNTLKFIEAKEVYFHGPK